MTPSTPDRPNHHQWARTAHMDGCHFYSSHYACKCGATAFTTTDRDPTNEYSAAVWMNADYGEPCERCAALLDGAPRTHHVLVRAQDGAIEQDELTTTCQE